MKWWEIIFSHFGGGGFPVYAMAKDNDGMVTQISRFR